MSLFALAGLRMQQQRHYFETRMAPALTLEALNWFLVGMVEALSFSHVPNSEWAYRTFAEDDPKNRNSTAIIAAMIMMNGMYPVGVRRAVP